LSPYDNAHIEIKSRSELDIMRVSGRILREILDDLSSMVKVGITTWDLEQRARKLFRDHKVRPAFLGYRDFPAALCTSINEEIVHGIPSRDRVLKSGDLVKIDAGLQYRGFYADSARTIPVGEVDDESRRLMLAARKGLEAGIAQAREGNRLGDISHAIHEVVHQAGFKVVREYTGHGIGRRLHEPPQIPNFGKAGSGPRLRHGMVFAVEPMVNAGCWETRTLRDQWTVVTADGRRSTHFEHTLVVSDDEPEILT